MKIPIYMDYHATTPVDPRVLEAMLPYFSEEFGNAASKSHAFGWRAEEAVKAAREEVAKLVGASREGDRLDERRDRVRQPGREGRGPVLQGRRASTSSPARPSTRPCSTRCTRSRGRASR